VLATLKIDDKVVFWAQRFFFFFLFLNSTLFCFDSTFWLDATLSYTMNCTNMLTLQCAVKPTTAHYSVSVFVGGYTLSRCL